MNLTVVIPTIGRTTLMRSVRSVLYQTVATELVVVSDVDESGCAGTTMNRGMANVETEWVAFLGDDDRLDVRYHEWFNLQYDGTADLFVFRMRYPEWWRDGLVLPEIMDPALWHLGDVGGSFIVRAELVREHPFMTDPCEDWNLIETLRDLGRSIQVSESVGYLIRH